MTSPFRTTALLAAGAVVGAAGTHTMIARLTPADPGAVIATLEASRRGSGDNVDRESTLRRVTSSPASPRGDVRAWANRDPAGFLAYARGSTRLDHLTDGLQLMVASDPVSVFELTMRADAPDDSRLASIRMLAVRAMVERAPLETLARIETLETATRGTLLRVAGEAFARIDPEGAIDWMQSLQPRSTSAELGVIEAIAASDFDRALALERSLPQRSFAQALLGPSTAAVAGATRAPRNTAAVTTALMRRDEPQATQLLATVLSTWIKRNPNAALDFVVAHQQELDAAIATRVAAELADADLDGAIASIERVPRAWRVEWIAQTANAYAEKDVEAAVRWIGAYRELPVYEDVLANVIVLGAAGNPAFAASHVEMLPPARQREAVANIVGPWLRADSAAATRWATGLIDPELAANAVSSLVFQWVQFQPQAAERWTLDAPPGPLRDAALRTLMRSSNDGKYDPTRFLGEFSSPEQRREAVRFAVRMLGADVERSEKLLRAALGDPVLAEWAHEQLTALGARAALP